MKLMTHHRVRHMPVLRDGKLAGIISIGDVVKYRLDDLAPCERTTLPSLIKFCIILS
jgi:CBS domain-containing protein